MKPTTYSIIEAALSSDDGLTDFEKAAILAFCRNPVAVRDPTDDMDLLTVEEVAARLRVCVRTVKRHLGAGRLGSVRIGGMRRVRMSDLRTFVGQDGDGGFRPREIPRALVDGPAVDRTRKAG